MSLLSVEAMPRSKFLKTNESDPLSFWNILICICPNSEKKVKRKGHYTFSYLKTKVQTHLAIKFLCVTYVRPYYIFVCNISIDKKYLIFVCNKCSNITQLLYYTTF